MFDHDAWIGRNQLVGDQIHATPARAMSATLGHSNWSALCDGVEIPPLWVWAYFLPIIARGELGADGHPERGGFLPPVALPRRMWAGGRLEFVAPLLIGQAIEKRSTVQAVTEKQGKSGPMVFVTVRHEIFAERQLAVIEEQDIVYLGVPAAPAVRPPLQRRTHCDWSEPVIIDPVLLFRYSALTFNGHRIHYDRSYAVNAEHYPGLVVHGPLQATLLLDAAMRRHPGRRPDRFTFRGLRPLFDLDQITLNGKACGDGGLDLFTAPDDGGAALEATVHWAAA